MYDVGQDGILAFTLDRMVFPVVGEFAAGFLSHHPLLNPFFAASVLLPVCAGAVE